MSELAGADVLNIIVYAIEGDYVEAEWSLFFTIPAVGSIIGLPFKYAFKLGGNAAEGLAKFTKKYAPELAESFGKLKRNVGGKLDDAWKWINKKLGKLFGNDAPSNPNIQSIIDGLKDADIIYKHNPLTGDMEPYMKQYTVNDDYKILLRKDYGGFNHNDPLGDHWNLEVQTIKGRTVYDLHIYVDKAGNILPITSDNIYIPSKSPFSKE